MPVFEKLISVIAPHTCISCSSEGSLVCNWCMPDFAPALPPRCYICSALSPDSRLCEKCRTKSRLKHVWVRTDYDGGPKLLVRKLKFSRAFAGANTIARLTTDTVGYLPPDTLLVPVPTATGRIRQRGYDQSLLLTKQLASIYGIKYVTALRRIGQSRQVGRNRKQRLEQLNGAFIVTNRKSIKGANIVLIDDVVTTGATLETAAKALREAGAKQVDALVFAQTPKTS